MKISEPNKTLLPEIFDYTFPDNGSDNEDNEEQTTSSSGLTSKSLWLPVSKSKAGWTWDDISSKRVICWGDYCVSEGMKSDHVICPVTDRDDFKFKIIIIDVAGKELVDCISMLI